MSDIPRQAARCERIHVCHISTMTRWGGVERMLIDFLSQATGPTVQHSLLCTSSLPDIIGAVRRLGAVSYTHLTLPTIYSV